MANPKKNHPNQFQTKTQAMMQSIGDSIRMERNYKGWSVTKLAQELGLSRNIIHRIEQGKSDPKISSLMAIYHAMGFGLRLRFVVEKMK